MNDKLEDALRNLLDVVAEGDVNREGLVETPARAAKAWQHWTGGYKVNVSALFKTFEDGASGYHGMVVRKGIRFYSHCEHHLAPIIGECSVAYIPKDRIVGLSKMDRVVDAFARRLQVQERLTVQIASAMNHYLDPVGVGVYITARHLCIESRGVQQVHSDTVTSCLLGAMFEGPARAEFLSFVR